MSSTTVSNVDDDSFQNFKKCHTKLDELENAQQNIYKTLTANGDSSIIKLIFTDFRDHTNQLDKPTFRIQPDKFEAWKELRFGSNFQLSLTTFKKAYKPLYQYPKLHYLASCGFIRAKHISKWTKIEPLLPQDLNEIQSVDDITRLMAIHLYWEKDGDNESTDRDETHQRKRYANTPGYIYIMCLSCSSWKDNEGNQLFKLGHTATSTNQEEVRKYLNHKCSILPMVTPEIKLLIKVENSFHLEQQILTVMQDEQCIVNTVNTTTSEFFSEKDMSTVLDIIKRRENSVWDYEIDSLNMKHD